MGGTFLVDPVLNVVTTVKRQIAVINLRERARVDVYQVGTVISVYTIVQPTAYKVNVVATGCVRLVVTINDTVRNVIIYALTV